jgi:hypothetical protein
MSIAAIGISAPLSVPVPVAQHSTSAAPSVAPTGAAPTDAVSISAAGHQAAASGDVDRDDDGH